MAEIITFRPTPEASEVLDRIKAEGGNVSKYLNELLAPTTIAGRSAYTYLYSYYPEPVKGSKSFNIRFGVRIKNMKEILSSLKGKEIYIQGNKCDQAMIITSVSQAEGEEVTTIFMPCSISDDDETEENS